MCVSMCPVVTVAVGYSFPILDERKSQEEGGRYCALGWISKDDYLNIQLNKLIIVEIEG